MNIYADVYAFVLESLLIAQVSKAGIPFSFHLLFITYYCNSPVIYAVFQSLF